MLVLPAMAKSASLLGAARGLASFNSLNLGVVVDKWQNQAGVLRSVTKTFDVVIILLQLIALIVGSITIYIVTFVDLNNKRKQIGIQRAIGISSATLVVNYVIRGIVYAVIGNLFGLVAYLFVLVPWERLHPFKFPFGIVFLEVNGSYLVQVFGVLFTIAVISSAIPTWRAIKIKILDAIWGN